MIILHDYGTVPPWKSERTWPSSSPSPLLWWHYSCLIVTIASVMVTLFLFPRFTIASVMVTLFLFPRVTIASVMVTLFLFPRVTIASFMVTLFLFPRVTKASVMVTLFLFPRYHSLCYGDTILFPRHHSLSYGNTIPISSSPSPLLWWHYGWRRRSSMAQAQVHVAGACGVAKTIYKLCFSHLGLCCWF